jgi:hypothetical protein
MEEKKALVEVSVALLFSAGLTSTAASAGSGESREASWPTRTTSTLQSLFAKLVIDFSLVLSGVSRTGRLAEAT